MVRPTQRREAVAWAREAYRLSERRACRVLRAHRSTHRYQSIRAHQEVLRRRLRELASLRTRAGYQQLCTLLRREGWPVNHKRIYRLYTEEGLTIRNRRPKRHRSAAVRISRPQPSEPNALWAMDFMHDALAQGPTIRVLTAIDVCTRECVALRVARGFAGSDVARILSEAGQQRGRLPGRIKVDNGTEFTSRALDHWAYWNQVELDFSRPGKPSDNAFIESFNATLRRECLSQHYFLSLRDAQQTLDAWREDYNKTRPHGSLAGVPPAEYRAVGQYLPRPQQLENSRS